MVFDSKYNINGNRSYYYYINIYNSNNFFKLMYFKKAKDMEPSKHINDLGDPLAS